MRCAMRQDMQQAIVQLQPYTRIAQSMAQGKMTYFLTAVRTHTEQRWELNPLFYCCIPQVDCINSISAWSL